MAVYCLSDVHGKRDVFHRMLEKIQFSEADTLFIIGDVVDRGPFGIELLEETMERPNIIMMLGNHEMMLADYFPRMPTKSRKNAGTGTGISSPRRRSWPGILRGRRKSFSISGAFRCAST